MNDRGQVNLDEAVAIYGEAAKRKLSGPGDREALITAPASDFLVNVGESLGLPVTPHDQVSELDGSVKPDFGVRVGGAIVGHCELKAPGTSLDPSTYGRTTHNYKQWQRLKELPNLLHSDGVEWRLWRYGVLAQDPVRMHTNDLTREGRNLAAPSRLLLLIEDFLKWEPAPITSISRLVAELAPLSRLLREEVKLALTAERRSLRGGAAIEDQPLLGAARDWKAILFPGATDAEFADGYAQTVTFALLLAVSDGIDLAEASLHDISQQLEAHHTLMARALNLLTEHVGETPSATAVEIIKRVLSAADWERLAANESDVYLYLYERFLATYDPEKRRRSGSYYTPIEIVDGMVRLADVAVREHFSRPQGLRNPFVTVVDPAMGTGTYPLSVLRSVGQDAADQYGEGARAEAVSSATARLYGLEIQSGPFSVAELRVTGAIRDAGAEFPSNGLNLYVADTLEDPYSTPPAVLGYSLQLIARQRQLANQMKREKNIQICIGNPPYKDHAGGMGGWIESGIDPRTGKAPLDAFRLPGNGRHERHLSNLYVYFWRWAFWKVFESTADPDVRDGDVGVVCFITATGYLGGPGFKGMRKYIREKCSHGWIINLTPEGKQPPAATAVFNIETPVAIGLFVRTHETDETEPAKIRYRELHGTREEKFAALATLDLGGDEWSEVRTDWTAPLTPFENAEWDDWPTTSDLMPWVAPGILAGRTWVYGTTSDVLEDRVREVVIEDDPDKRSSMFVERGNINLARGRAPLPGADTQKGTETPFSEIRVVNGPPAVVQVGFRGFDRQWLLPDSRLIMRPSPSLWRGRIPGQVFAVELHSEHPRRGPGLAFSALIPDVHYFRGSGGGRVLPWLNEDGSANVASGLREALAQRLGIDVQAGDVLMYMAGVVAHPDFVEEFDDELRTPGIRVPLTAIGDLWEEAVHLGRLVIWLNTFGAAGEHPDGLGAIGDLRASNPDLPAHVDAVRDLPTALGYDPDVDGGTLTIGGGRWINVSQAVRDYEMGGANVLDRWLSSRLREPRGRRSSDLDGINAVSWQSEWSEDLTDALVAITTLISVHERQANLLERILENPLISREQLSDSGVSLGAATALASATTNHASQATLEFDPEIPES